MGVENARAVCSCRDGFFGNPIDGCKHECESDFECGSDRACINFRCDDPCTSCGTYAECRVTNHKAICSCPKGYTGHPFDRCRPFTKSDLCEPNPCGSNADCKPGTDRSGNDRPVCFCRAGFLGDPLVSCNRGECVDHEDCAANRACYGYKCVDPCVSTSSRSGQVCGTSARCDARNHGAVCSCPVGYDGDPLTSCRPSFNR